MSVNILVCSALHLCRNETYVLQFWMPIYCSFRVSTPQLLSINLQMSVLNAHILQFQRHYALIFVLTKPRYYGFKCPYTTLTKAICYTSYQQKNLYTTILNAHVRPFQRPLVLFF